MIVNLSNFVGFYYHKILNLRFSFQISSNTLVDIAFTYYQSQQNLPTYSLTQSSTNFVQTNR